MSSQKQIAFLLSKQEVQRATKLVLNAGRWQETISVDATSHSCINTVMEMLFMDEQPVFLTYNTLADLSIFHEGFGLVLSYSATSRHFADSQS